MSAGGVEGVVVSRYCLFVRGGGLRDLLLKMLEWMWLVTRECKVPGLDLVILVVHMECAGFGGRWR